jgi:hypothetical protein
MPIGCNERIERFAKYFAIFTESDGLADFMGLEFGPVVLHGHR